MQFKERLQDILENDPLGLLDEKPKASTVASADERLLASFQEINEFYMHKGREPQANGDIQEHSLYSRLQGLRKNPLKREALLPHDEHGLLAVPEIEINSIDDIFADDALGILDDDALNIFDTSRLPKETTMPGYVAKRKKCKDFGEFEHLFKQCHSDLEAEKRKLWPFAKEQQIDKGLFFILKGVLLYVADIGERENVKGKVNARLRCIFENGTESDMLLRSLSAELYKDGRRVLEHEDMLLSELENVTEKDKESGSIYILRSKSADPEIASIKDLYKIGYTKLSIEERIKNAENEATYLMSPVNIVTAYKCFNMNPHKLEQLLQQFFGNSCLNIDVYDQKGKRHTPREWFIAPIEVIEQAVHFLISGEITDYEYDTRTKTIINRVQE